METAWPMYFNGEPAPEDGDDPRPAAVDALRQYLAGRAGAMRRSLRRGGHIAFDLRDLADAPLDVTRLLNDEPTNLIACMQLAAHLVLAGPDGGPEPKSPLPVRFSGHGPVTPMRAIKSENVERFVTLKGTVVRMTAIQPLVVGLRFICARCGAETVRHFPGGRYDPPSTCVSEGCKGRGMQADRGSAQTVDYQRIRLQESFSDDVGRMPRTIDVELREGLVDSCRPGDLVTVCGIVKADRAEGKGQTCLYVLYIAANNVVNDKHGSNPEAAGATTYDCNTSFTLYDLHGINAIFHCEDVLSLVVNSLCPGIFGHELVKAGLCLGLFSGVRKYVGSSHQIPKRGDIHVLLLGDPGLGKSQLLRGCMQVAPRAVYVCGNATSTAGLTVSLVKDGGGESALEAGALVLADNGLCCIDEFDKLTGDPQALLEAMEQQSISITKGGICCSVSARATVFVAANPIGGHYNRRKTVLENLRISPALLSRFDLVFVLIDSPDARRDALLSEHVLALHSGDRTRQDSCRVPQYSQRTNNLSDAYLSTRIKLQGPQGQPDFDPLPPALLRKYIQYSQQYVHPKLSPEARATFKQFYLQLRRESNVSCADGSRQVTTRQLESLIRLGEARARLELREIVTEQDAWDVIEIMKESLFDLYADEFAPVDVASQPGKRGGSRTKQAKEFIKVAGRRVSQGHPDIFDTNAMKDMARQAGCPAEEFEAFIELLNQNNVILHKGNKRYKFLGS
ncbi:Minichromosome maintenance 8 [Plasmodiophora brassicae]